MAIPVILTTAIDFVQLMMNKQNQTPRCAEEYESKRHPNHHAHEENKSVKISL